ncbi:MAG: GatB/YqeY domain-containing protein [Bacteroidales bacterium]|nr:GatB/YqeY domain-containing protein [Bacteroidales bacterium]MCR5551101.1 GatB/YqeY domain-containing protein [Bacteroidales bacterium]
MTLEERINEDIKAAMLAREKEKLNALRAIKSAILLAKTSKGAADTMSEEAEIKLLKQLVKQRQDSAAIYKEQNRDDLYQEEKAQLDVIAAYLPQMMSEEEIEATLKQIITDNGFAGMKDMGKVMGMATKAFAGKADNKTVSDIVKRLLA